MCLETLRERFRAAGPVHRAVVVVCVLVALCGAFVQTRHALRFWDEIPYPAVAGDEANYWRVAQKIADGEPATDDLGFYSYRTVVFPAAAVPGILVFGDDARSLALARRLVFACALAVPLAAFLLAWLLCAGSQRWIAALAVSAVLAWSYPLYASSMLFMPDTPALLGALLCLSGLVRLHRSTDAGFVRPLLLGAAAAVTALVKFDYLGLFVAAFGCYLIHVAFFVTTGAARPPLRERLRKPRLRGLGLAALAFAGVLGLYGLRNAHHTGHLFLTSKAGANLWIGNNPDADTTYQWREEWGSSIVGDEVASQRHHTERALAYVRSEPGHFLRGLLAKFRAFVSLSLDAFPQLGLAGRLLAAALHVLVLLTAVALFVPARRRRLGVDVLALSLLYALELAVLVLFFVEPRFLLLNGTLATVLAAAAVTRSRRERGTGRALAR